MGTFRHFEEDKAVAGKDEKREERWNSTRGKFTLALVVVPILLVGGFSVPEVAVRLPPERTCVVCHEMKDPVKRWSAAGVARSHENCADCHADQGIARTFQLNRMAWRFLWEHLRRDPDQPIHLPPEPLFVDAQLEPAYYSLVPNHRCLSCKEVAGHRPIEQAMSHNKLILFASAQPCRDCHSHDMRNGQPFYEKILLDQTTYTRPEGTSDRK